jgi:3-dehydroshikimate dehydratase
MLTPGLVSVSFRKESPAKIAAAAAAAGLKSVEWGGDVHVPQGDIVAAREVAALAQDHDLAIAAYGSYYYAGWSPAQGLEFPLVLETALALGAPCIRVWSGREGSSTIPPEQRARVVADLRRCVGQAAAAGLRVATEFHSGTLMDTAASARAVFEEIAHPDLRAYWQPQDGEKTPRALASLRALAPWLENVHVFHWWPSLVERHPLAEGADRWRSFLQEAALAPVAQHALLEFMPGNSLAELAAEAATLRELLHERPKSLSEKVRLHS